MRSDKNMEINNVTYGCLLDACVKNNEINYAVKVWN